MKKIIVFFGICDILRLGLYLIAKLKDMKIPFVSDIINCIKLAIEEGHTVAYLFGFAGLLLFLSLIFSGYFLIKRKVMGAWVVYLQFPLRLFLLTPSIPFIIRIIRNFTSNLFPLAFSFLVLLEIIKLIIVMSWHRGLIRRNIETWKIGDVALENRGHTI